MQNILDLSKTNKLILAAFAFLAVLAFSSGRAHAATITVAGSCSLEEAIVSVNSAAAETDCVSNSVGTYGTADRITIPAGTQTLTGDLTTLTADVEIQGAGMSQTTINGDMGQYTAFYASGVTIKISDLKVTAYNNIAIATNSSNVELNNIEVDGTDAQNADYNVRLDNTTSSTKLVTANNIYIHDVQNSESLMYLILVHQRGGGTTNATLSNITLADSSNTSGGVDGFAVGIGAYGAFGGTGTVNATITNATIDNISAANINAPYASFAFSSGGPANTTVNVYNSTITGSRGITGNAFPLVGVRSAAFYSAAAGLGSGTTGTSVLNVGNSLLADNMSDSTSSNCESVDFTAGFSGAGTGVSSIISEGHNISDDASCNTFTGAGDQQNLSNIISTLGPLQNNGGAVPTRALLAGSPAVTAGGQVLGVTTDARGIARPNACPSVGAFQFEGAVCAATTTNANTNAGNAAAPNTGIGSTSIMLAVIAGILGFASLGYIFATKHV